MFLVNNFISHNGRLGNQEEKSPTLGHMANRGRAKTQAPGPPVHFFLSHAAHSRALSIFGSDNPGDLYPTPPPLHPPLSEELHCNARAP